MPTQKGFPALWGLQTLALTGSFQRTLSYELYHSVCKLHYRQVMIQNHLKPIPVPHAKDYPSHPLSPSAPLPQAPVSNKQPSSILGAVKSLMNFWPKCKSFPWSYRREKKSSISHTGLLNQGAQALVKLSIRHTDHDLCPKVCSSCVSNLI